MFQQDLAPCKMQGRLSSVENKGCFLFSPLLCLRDFRPKHWLEVPCLCGFSLRRHPADIRTTTTVHRAWVCGIKTWESYVPQEVVKPQTLSAATGLGGTFLYTCPCWSIHFWPWSDRAAWETDLARLLWCSRRWLTQVLDWTKITKYLDTVAPLFPFGSGSFAIISFPSTSQPCTGSVRSSLSFTNLCLEICFLRNDTGTYIKQLTSVLRIFSCRWNYYSSLVL